MVKFAILATLEAKIGKEHEVAAFLKSALPLVEAEPGTVAWFAIRISPTTFGIFDVFPDEASRDAHLAGAIGSRRPFLATGPLPAGHQTGLSVDRSEQRFAPGASLVGREGGLASHGHRCLSVND